MGASSPPAIGCDEAPSSLRAATMTGVPFCTSSISGFITPGPQHACNLHASFTSDVDRLVDDPRAVGERLRALLADGASTGSLKA